MSSREPEISDASVCIGYFVDGRRLAIQIELNPDDLQDHARIQDVLKSRGAIPDGKSTSPAIAQALVKQGGLSRLGGRILRRQAIEG